MSGTVDAKTKTRIVIIGAGPTGLGALWRFQEWQKANPHLAERVEIDLYDNSAHAGGLAGSITDKRGFTWDFGGHVEFSHYAYFTSILDQVLPNGYLHHPRNASACMWNRFIPYPVQQHIEAFPTEKAIEAMDGLLTEDRHRCMDVISPRPPPKHFGEWLQRTFGHGLMECFGRPYNTKVWAYPPEALNVEWMGERVAPVSFQEQMHKWIRKDSIVDTKVACASSSTVDAKRMVNASGSWGPNAMFRFPKSGGTGAIWRAVALALPASRMHYGSSVEKIDSTKRTVVVNGQSVPYDLLLSTMPLDLLCRRLEPTVKWSRTTLDEFSTQFRYSTVHVVGLGLRGMVPEELKHRSWVYFPEPDVPFYRMTIFSNYSPAHVPDPKLHWSLLFETSELPNQKKSGWTKRALIDKITNLLLKWKWIDRPRDVMSAWYKALTHGYPTPFLARKEVCEPLHSGLEDLGIWSRGRFGGWKYEVSNQDHSFMQGVEAIDHWFMGRTEWTFRHPELVNAKPSIPVVPLSTPVSASTSTATATATATASIADTKSSLDASKTTISSPHSRLGNLVLSSPLPDLFSHLIQPQTLAK